MKAITVQEKHINRMRIRASRKVLKTNYDGWTMQVKYCPVKGSVFKVTKNNEE